MNAVVQAGTAKTMPGMAGSADVAQYLTFMLGGEVFAIGILAIKEIIEFHGVTEVPMMPECIRGVINLRGSVVPVLDLSARFGKAGTVVGKRTCVVIVEVQSGGERHDIGVLVDAVNAVLEIPGSQIEAPPSFGAKIRSDFIRGMGKVDGKFVIILHVDHVLSPQEIGAIGSLGTLGTLGNSTTAVPSAESALMS